MERKKTKRSTTSPPEKKTIRVRKSKTAVDLAAPNGSLAAYLPSEDEIARKAYTLWELRGKPFGSPDQDWYQAERELHASS